MSVITSIHGRQILDSRGNPTVEVDVVLIEPPDLHHFLLADGVMPRVEGLVHQIEPIVRV